MMSGFPTHRELSWIAPLNVLQSRIRQATEAQGRDEAALEGLLEQLPYSLAGAAHAAVALARAQTEAVDSVKHRVNPDPGVLAIYQMEPEELDPASFAVDAYLDSARRAQNAVWPYLSKVLRRSVAKSLSSTVATLSSKPGVFPERIRHLILNYWTSAGARVKDYRDLAQHHGVVSSDGRVYFQPDGSVSVYLVLPNNPDDKEPGRLKYLDPRIDAGPFVWESYWALYAFVYELCHLLVSYTSDTPSELIGFQFKGALRFGKDVDAHKPLSLDNLIADHWIQAKALKQRLDAELPRADVHPTLIIPGDRP